MIAIALTALMMFSQTSFSQESLDKGPVLEIEATRVNIGGVWYNFHPDIESVDDVINASEHPYVNPPFQAEITFCRTEDSTEPVVKKLKILKKMDVAVDPNTKEIRSTKTEQ